MSQTQQTWIYYPPGGKLVQTEENKSEKKQEKGEDFYERFYETDIDTKHSNIEKTSKIAAAITCATALGGSDGSMENSKMTAG